MTAAGLKKVEEAKLDGSWYKLDSGEELRLPEEFAQALALDEAARRNFGAFKDSTKKQILLWIESAKMQKTRAKIIQRAVLMAKQNEKTFLSST